MAKMARFAMEFCAVESCGKCTPCRIGSVRGVETIDRIVAGGDAAAIDAPDRSLRDDEGRIALRDGGLDALSGDVGAPPLPRGLHRQPRRRPRSEGVSSLPRSTTAISARPPSHAETTVSLTIDGFEVTRPRRHPRHARRGARRHRGAEALRHRQPGGVRLLPALPRRDRGAPRPPASCTTPVADGHGGAHPVARKLAGCARG